MTRDEFLYCWFESQVGSDVDVDNDVVESQKFQSIEAEIAALTANSPAFAAEDSGVGVLLLNPD